MMRGLALASFRVTATHCSDIYDGVSRVAYTLLLVWGSVGCDVPAMLGASHGS